MSAGIKTPVGESYLPSGLENPMWKQTAKETCKDGEVGWLSLLPCRITGREGLAWGFIFSAQVMVNEPDRFVFHLNID